MSSGARLSLCGGPGSGTRSARRSWKELGARAGALARAGGSTWRRDGHPAHCRVAAGRGVRGCCGSSRSRWRYRCPSRHRRSRDWRRRRARRYRCRPRACRCRRRRLACRRRCRRRGRRCRPHQRWCDLRARRQRRDQGPRRRRCDLRRRGQRFSRRWRRQRHGLRSARAKPRRSPGRVRVRATAATERRSRVRVTQAAGRPRATPGSAHDPERRPAITDWRGLDGRHAHGLERRHDRDSTPRG